MVKKTITPRASADCPCGSCQPYGICCGAWHEGFGQGRHAPSPEALMRSRYSAYVLGLIDYLRWTWHPSTAPGNLELEAVKWLGLELKAVQSSKDAGVVEFVARYRDGNGRAQRLHEVSRFVREQRRWFYVDGVFTQRDEAPPALMPTH